MSPECPRRDVAEAAGVSLSTVSRVLGGKSGDLFAPDTRQRVVEAAHRLGYQTNHFARALVTGRTNLVTLWIAEPYRPFFGMVVEQVEKQAQRHGYALFVTDVMLREPSGGPPPPVLPSDGILAMDCGLWADDIFRARPAPHTPIVSMGSAPLPGTDSVRLELAGTVREAVRHLAAQGCRRLAYFSFVPPEPVLARQQGFDKPREAFLATVREAGLAEELIPWYETTRESARRTIVQYVGEHGCPDGILCRNDDMAIATYRALCDLGVAVGRDVLLVGCDGIEDGQYLHCPLSTMAFPVARMCQLAWEFLERRMADPSAAPRHAVLEATLEIRESSQTPLRRRPQRPSRKKSPATRSRKGKPCDVCDC